MRWIVKLAALLLVLLLPRLATAQSVDLQIILPSAAQMPKNIEDWEADPTIVQIVMTNLSSDDLNDLWFSFNIRGATRGQLAESKDQHPRQPRFSLGPNESRAFFWEEVIHPEALQFAGGLEADVVRDGIPEDNYTICAQVVAPNGQPVSMGGERCTPFTITNPDPPSLLFPTADQPVNPATLQFQWTAVNMPGVSYQLTIKPQFVGQDLQTAMAGNPILFEEEVNSTSYFYLPSDPPFDVPGAIGYVWRVQSLVDFTPVGRNGGMSPVVPFTLERAPIVTQSFSYPAFNPILTVDLRDLKVDATDGTEVLVSSGTAPAQLSSGGSMDATFRSVLLDPLQGTIASGRIELQDRLSFQIRMGGLPFQSPPQTWGWMTVPSGAAVTSGHLIIDTWPDVVITDEGFVSERGGVGKGRTLGFCDPITGECLPDDTGYSVNFEPGTVIAPAPLGVVEGGFTLSLRNGTIARVDPTGLYLEAAISPPEPETPVFTWAIPNVEQPIFTIETTEFSPGEDGTMLNGAGLVQGQWGTNDASFDNLYQDFDEQISFGAGVISGPMHLAANVEPTTGSISGYRGAAAGTAPGSNGFHLDLNGLVILDRDGLKPTDVGVARVQHPDVPSEPLAVRFSDDFAFALNPFGISQGTATFSLNGSDVAQANAQGFFASEAAPEPVAMTTWSVPTQAPVFDFTFPTDEATALNGEYDVNLLPYDANLSAAFTNATFDANQQQLTGGTASLQAYIALGADIDPQTGLLRNFSNVDPFVNPSEPNRLFLSLQSTISFDAAGYRSSFMQGGIGLEGVPEGYLNVSASNDFRLNYTTGGIAQGDLVFYTQDGVEVAYANTSGLFLSDPVEPLPGAEPAPFARGINWRFPSDDPFLVFDVADADLDSLASGGLTADGMSIASIGPETTTQAAFIEASLSPDGLVTNGLIRLMDSFGVAVAMRSDNLEGGSNQWRWAAVNPNAPAPATPGFSFNLPAGLEIRTEGLVSSQLSTPITTGFLNISGLPEGPYEVRFSNNFALGGSPIGVASGVLTFELDGLAYARVNRDGFFLEVDPSTAAEASLARWNVPKTNPMLSFALTNPSMGEGGIMSEGPTDVTTPDGDRRAVLRGTLFSANDTTLFGGTAIVDAGLTISASLDPTTGQLGTFTGQASESPLLLDPGVQLVMTGPMTIRKTYSVGWQGLRPARITQALLYHPTLPVRALDVAMSSDFAFSDVTMAIASGRLTFSLNGQEVGYADESGLFIDGAANPLEASLPNLLALPDPGIASVRLKATDGSSLVEVVKQPDGSLVLAPKAGASLTMTLPALEPFGVAGTPIAARFRDVRIDSETFALLGGTITADVPPGDPRFDLTTNGAPLTVTSLEGAIVDGNPALRIGGTLRLFGQAIGGTNGVTMVVGPDGRMQANLDVQNLAARLPLVANSDALTLEVSRVGGTLDLTSGITNLAIELDGQLRLDASGQSVSRADVALLMTRMNDLRVTRFTPDANVSGVVPLDRLALNIGGFQTLTDFRYSDATGFNFVLGLDLSLQATVGQTSLDLPLSNAELRPTGFVIPRQDETATDAAQDFGPVGLRLLSLQLDAQTFDWFSWSPGQPVPLAPDMQFEVTFPGFAGTSQTLADATVTLNNARLENGLLTGGLLDFTFAGEGAFVPFAGDAGVVVNKIGGRFFDDSGQQGFDINFEGGLRAGSLFTDADPACAEPSVTMALSTRDSFAGTVSDFVPCGNLLPNSLPLTLEFNRSSLDVAFTPDEKRLIVDGDVTATLNDSNFSDASATGSIRADLVSGTVEDASLTLRDFSWSYPKQSPLFTFQVGEATVTPEGFVFTGGGTFDLPSAGGQPSIQPIDVTFTDLGVDFATSAITSGSVGISSGFSLAVSTSPFKWSLSANTQLTDAQTNQVLLVLQGGLTIDQEGLGLSGTSTAALNVGDKFHASMALAFEDDFKLAFEPIGVTQGRAVLSRDGNEIAYFSRTGFHLTDALAILNIPPTMGLPNEETAFIRLLDDAQEKVVVLGENPDAEGLWQLATIDGKEAVLVLAGLKNAAGESPEIALSFDVQVDDAFAIQSGSISIDLTNSPVNLMDYGFPFDLHQIAYAQDGGTFSLSASAFLSLPLMMNGTPIDLSSDLSLTFTNNGFEQVSVTTGSYGIAHDPSATDAEITSFMLNEQSGVKLSIRGVSVEVGNQRNLFGISGDITSDVFGQVEGKPALLHFHSSFDGDSNTWDFNLDATHLPERKLPLKEAFFQVSDNPEEGPRLAIGDDTFELSLKGILTLPDRMGPDFALTIDQFSITHERVDFKTAATVNQEFTMFKEFLKVTVQKVYLEFDGGKNVLYTGMDGLFETKLDTDRPCAATPRPKGCPETAPTQDRGEAMSFERMIVGSDGSFSIGAGEVNLLTAAGREKIDILNDVFWINEMKIGLQSDNLLLTVGGEVELPLPKRKNQADQVVNAPYRMTIDAKGTESIGELTFNFDTDPVPQIGNNPYTEVDLGQFGVIELTAAALDFNILQPSRANFYAAGGIHVKSKQQEGTTAQTKDKNGKHRWIPMGDPTAVRERPGFAYSTVDGFVLSLDAQGTKDNPLFTFEAGVFAIDLTTVVLPDISLSSPNFETFEVELGGYASLNMSGLSGSFGYEGFKFNQDGVQDWGRPMGGFSLSVADVLSLEVGCFDYRFGEGGTVPLSLSKPAASSDGTSQSTETETVNVTQYLKFGGDCGGDALSLSMGEGFSASVQEVVYYEGAGGGNRLSIQGINMDLKAASLYANFNYENDGQGGFEIKVAGVGKIGDKSLGALGKISTLNDKLSFGIFLAAQGLNVDLLAPIGVANTVLLTGIGGGFFYNPSNDDIAEVYRLLEVMNDGNFRVNNPNGLPQADNLKFAIMLYAGIGLVGMPPNSVVDAKGLITVTDQFTNIDLNGQLLRQGDKLGGGAYLTVEYGLAGGGVYGGFRLDVDYFKVIEGTMRLDFAYSNKQGEENWSIYGQADLTVISFIDMDGRFLISKEGFVASLSVEASFDAGIVGARGAFAADFWYTTATGDFGAYATVEVEAWALEIIKINAGLKGAVIRESGDYLIFATAYADVCLGALCWDGQVWVSVENGSADGGLGDGGGYATRIEAARKKAQQMLTLAETAKQEAAEARSELAALQEELQRQAYDAEVLATLQSTEQEVYRHFGKKIYFDGNPNTIQWWNNLNVGHQNDVQYNTGQWYNWGSNRVVPNYQRELYQWDESFNYLNMHLRGGNGTAYTSYQNTANIRPPVFSLSYTTSENYNRPRLAALRIALNRAENSLSRAETELGKLAEKAREYSSRAVEIREGFTPGPSPLTQVQWPSATSDGGSFAVNADMANQQREALAEQQNAQAQELTRYQSALRELADLHWTMKIQLQAAQTGGFADAMDAVNTFYESRFSDLEAHWNSARIFRSYMTSSAFTNHLNNLIDRDLQNARTAQFSGPRDPAPERDRLSAVIGFRRVFLQERVANDQFQDVLFRNNLAMGGVTDLEPIFREVAKNVYYDVHKYGLDHILPMYPTIFEEYKSALGAQQQAIISQYTDYTTAVDSLYGVQVALAQYTYGMANDLKQWVRGSGLVTESTSDAQIERLYVKPKLFNPYYHYGYELYADELIPPDPSTHANVSQQPFCAAQIFKGRIGWSISYRPEGAQTDRGVSIVEASVSINGSDLVSVGRSTSRSFDFSMPEVSQASTDPTDFNPPTLDVSIRLRGSGGTTNAITPLTPLTFRHNTCPVPVAEN
ncbi:MAG: hypothetical protein RhofKO_18550 [Rhodothermales bacterium]